MTPSLAQPPLPTPLLPMPLTPPATSLLPLPPPLPLPLPQSALTGLVNPASLVGAQHPELAAEAPDAPWPRRGTLVALILISVGAAAVAIMHFRLALRLPEALQTLSVAAQQRWMVRALRIDPEDGQRLTPSRLPTSFDDEYDDPGLPTSLDDDYINESPVPYPASSVASTPYRPALDPESRSRLQESLD